jgi:sigma-B regulation protein RsbU (phosphoserine phosphatase)
MRATPTSRPRNRRAPRRGEDHLDLVAELIDAFAGSEDLDATLAAALVRIAEALDADAAGLFLLDRAFGDPDAKLVCRACFGPIDVTGLILTAGIGIPGRALSLNRTQLVRDAAGDPDFLSPATIGIDYEIRSLICAPLSHRDERYGVVEILNPRPLGRLFGPRDANLLGLLATSAAIAIRNARLTAELVAQNRLRRELEMAAEVQRNLLPPTPSAEVPVQGLNRPARGVSGDFYDVLRLPDDRIAFALADVSGKGLNAALIMVKTATLFRSLARRIHEPGLLLTRIEAELVETMSFGMFVTMVIGVYDPARHEVRLANAGHLPVLRRAADGGYTEFPALDPPLGILTRPDHDRYQEAVLSIEGGCLYLYTDGASEARQGDGEMLGTEGLKALIERHAGSPPGTRLAAIADAIGDQVRDDLTLLVIEDSAAAAEQLAPRGRRRGIADLVAQTIPADAAQLKVVRRLVEAASREAGASVEWAQDLVLAVDEACQNIIRHGYGTAAKAGATLGERIELSIRKAADGLEVELVDYAKQVVPGEIRGRPLDEVRPGGLGSHLIHVLTDLVQFRAPPKGGGNRLVLTKKLGPAADDGSTDEHDQQGSGPA